MSDTISVERRGHVLLIGLNRPDKLNAMDPELIRALCAAYTQLDRDRELRCGVLHAHGRYFTSGLDLAKVVAELPKVWRPLIPWGKVNPWATWGRACRKPIVSAVEGTCYTAGIELVLAGQVTVVSKTASFIQSEVARGIFPFGGGTVRWPLAIGTHNAFYYLLTAGELSAAEAHRLGLAQKLVEPGQALATAVEIAETIAKQAPLGIQATLQSVRRAQSKGAQSAFNKLKFRFMRLLLSKDARRGVEAFKARKEAVFQGD